MLGKGQGKVRWWSDGQVNYHQKSTINKSKGIFQQFMKFSFWWTLKFFNFAFGVLRKKYEPKQVICQHFCNWMSWIWNFLLKITQDHLGPSPEAIGSTWFFQKATSWKMTIQTVPWKCHTLETLESKDKSDTVQERSNLWGQLSPWGQCLEANFLLAQEDRFSL